MSEIAIGFGTGQLGEDTFESVVSAAHAGYRLIDTASRYNNEAAVGEAVQYLVNDPATGLSREDLHITTKVWAEDHGFERAHEAFRQSLGRLGLQYIDHYLIHWPQGGKLEETWRAMEEIQLAGQARAIGVCNFDVHQLHDLMQKGTIPPVVNQIEFHPFAYEQQEPILNFCKKNNITVQGYCPLADGVASREETRLLEEIAERYQKQTGQLMLRWSHQHGVVPLPRSRNSQHIAANINIFDFHLSEDDMTLINSLSNGTRLFTHP